MSEIIVSNSPDFIYRRTTRRAETIAELFYRHVPKVEADNCINWRGGTDKNGYGSVRFKGKLVKAHRVAYEMANRAIPDGLEVCHRCDNPACCNPRHLFVGTQKDNMKDCVDKGRRPRGSNSKRSKLTEKDVADIRIAIRNRETQRSIATRYGVCQSAISLINSKVNWGHLQD